MLPVLTKDSENTFTPMDWFFPQTFLKGMEKIVKICATTFFKLEEISTTKLFKWKYFFVKFLIFSQDLEVYGILIVWYGDHMTKQWDLVRLWA